MKTVVFLFLLLAMLSLLVGCGNRVPGSADNANYKRYQILKDTDPKDL